VYLPTRPESANPASGKVDWVDGFMEDFGKPLPHLQQARYEKRYKDKSDKVAEPKSGFFEHCSLHPSSVVLTPQFSTKSHFGVR
jgi:hypothetical protein